MRAGGEAEQVRGRGRVRVRARVRVGVRVGVRVRVRARVRHTRMRAEGDAEQVLSSGGMVVGGDGDELGYHAGALVG